MAARQPNRSRVLEYEICFIVHVTKTPLFSSRHNLPPQSPQNLMRLLHEVPQLLQTTVPVVALFLGGKEVPVDSYMLFFLPGRIGTGLEFGTGDLAFGGDSPSGSLLGGFPVIGFGLERRTGEEMFRAPLTASS